MSVQFRPDEESRGTMTALPGANRCLRTFPLKQRTLLRKLTTELASLQERVEAANLDTFKLDDDLQSLSEALRTAVADLRHAQAALGWLVNAGRAKTAAAAQ
ncbi:hypothetical protein [Reyranella sp. CPCC 100927]|uniref:hypothetical protein n=1 Tax=Reyranella sp. CPCC 100927 TaxID=2599616 RepID=UPI0011B41C92|nr:hypothetical protein [Reyranella sp. CPCC 100927]TWT05927.1 hypothetical protein FQU96_22995 [Reyranella sp. CPCC 100927]